MIDTKSKKKNLVDHDLNLDIFTTIILNPLNYTTNRRCPLPHSHPHIHIYYDASSSNIVGGV
jgi:hypothetical protein